MSEIVSVSDGELSATVGGVFGATEGDTEDDGLSEELGLKLGETDADGLKLALGESDELGLSEGDCEDDGERDELGESEELGERDGLTEEEPDVIVRVYTLLHNP